MKIKQKNIHDAGTTNPVKQSTKIRDDGPAHPDRKTDYEQETPKSSYAIHETINLTFCNRIVSGVPTTPDRRIIGGSIY